MTDYPQFIHLSSTSIMTRFEYIGGIWFETAPGKFHRMPGTHIRVMLKRGENKMSFNLYEN